MMDAPRPTDRSHRLFASELATRSRPIATAVRAWPGGPADVRAWSHGEGIFRSLLRATLPPLPGDVLPWSLHLLGVAPGGVVVASYNPARIARVANRRFFRWDQVFASPAIIDGTRVLLLDGEPFCSAAGDVSWIESHRPKTTEAAEPV